MIKQNKLLIIGFLILFIIGTNIYNVPSKPINEAIPVKKITPESQKKVNIETLIKSLKSQSSHINLTNKDYLIATFWATWCPACGKENIIFNQFIKDFKNTEIVGICTDKNPFALEEYLKTKEINFITINNTKDIAIHFDDINAVPTHFIIDLNKKTMIKKMGLISYNELKGITKND